MNTMSKEKKNGMQICLSWHETGKPYRE
jgi:hypothetical protein